MGGFRVPLAIPRTPTSPLATPLPHIDGTGENHLSSLQDGSRSPSTELFGPDDTKAQTLVGLSTRKTQKRKAAYEDNMSFRVETRGHFLHRSVSSVDDQVQGLDAVTFDVRYTANANRFQQKQLRWVQTRPIREQPVSPGGGGSPINGGVSDI